VKSLITSSPSQPHTGVVTQNVSMRNNNASKNRTKTEEVGHIDPQVPIMSISGQKKQVRIPANSLLQPVSQHNNRQPLQKMFYP